MAAGPALAAQAVAVSIEELARSSDLVVRGQVVSTSARWQEGRIYTFAEVEVTSSIRGASPAKVTVMTPGGVVGDIGQRVDGAAVLAPGEEVVLFLGRSGTGELRVTGLAQGKFSVDGRTARPDLSRVDFVSTHVPADERRAETMPLSELETRVRRIR